MATFVWINGAGASLVEAKDRDEAYRKVIACRMAVADGATEAERLQSAVDWSAENDRLEEIDMDPVTDEPYAGELPEPTGTDLIADAVRGL